MAERPDLERLQQHASGEDFNACSCWQCPDVGADVRTLIDYTLATEARLDAALPVLEAARAQAVWFRSRNPALWDESEAKALMAAVETWEAGA